MFTRYQTVKINTKNPEKNLSSFFSLYNGMHGIVMGYNSFGMVLVKLNGVDFTIPFNEIDVEEVKYPFYS